MESHRDPGHVGFEQTFFDIPGSDQTPPLGLTDVPLLHFGAVCLVCPPVGLEAGLAAVGPLPAAAGQTAGSPAHAAGLSHHVCIALNPLFATRLLSAIIVKSLNILILVVGDWLKSFLVWFVKIHRMYLQLTLHTSESKLYSPFTFLNKIYMIMLTSLYWIWSRMEIVKGEINWDVKGRVR